MAQCMTIIPFPATLGPLEEVGRYSWLLQGTREMSYEIHGGCGFSRKLLHVISQITYCAGRLQQDAESVAVPITAEFLQRELTTMRQWSIETTHWKIARRGSPIIDWVRTLPEPFSIGTPQEMTEVTAEAWRLATLIYLQCRVLR